MLEASAGVAHLSPGNLDLAVVDQAMYAAKRAGGGRVAVIPEEAAVAVANQVVAPSSAVTKDRPNSSSEIPV